MTLMLEIRSRSLGTKFIVHPEKFERPHLNGVLKSNSIKSFEIRSRSLKVPQMVKAQ